MTDARYPNFAGKHAEDPFFTPEEFVAYGRRTGRIPEFDAPLGIVLCYQRSIWERALSEEGAGRADLRARYGMALVGRTDGRVAVIGGFGIGAPRAALLLEELIALGTSRFVSIGTAGSLQKACGIGDLVVCDRAIRDEGVSHHYLPPATHAYPDPSLTDALAGRLDATRGTAWTIDTPFRETTAEARHYQREGVLCVEMEAAALFAVGAHRGVAVASAFTISDSLADLVWDPQFHAPETDEGLVALFDAAVDTLDESPPDLGMSRRPIGT